MNNNPRIQTILSEKQDFSPGVYQVKSSSEGCICNKCLKFTVIYLIQEKVFHFVFDCAGIGCII